MSTLSVQTITDIRSIDFANTQFAGAYDASNAAYDAANASYGVANSVNTFAYGVAINTAAAFAAANNVGPQIAPTFNTANAAFAAANASVQNTTTSFFTGIAANLDASGITTSIKLPVGSTAQRPGSAANGSIRFNTNLNVLEYYAAGTWSPIAPPPTLTSATPTSYTGNAGTSFTFRGTYFDSLAIAYFILANGSILTAGSTSVANSFQLTATTPRGISIAEGPLSVYVVNGSGLSTSILSNYISTGNAPAWSTAAGTIATCYDSMRSGFNTSVAATDADGQSITYTLTSGSLPTGMSLDGSTGAITGTPSAVGSDTTYSFTLNATDSLGNSTARTFNIVIKAPTVLTYNYTGGDQTMTLPGSVSKFTAYLWGAGGGAGPAQGGAGGYTTGTVTTSLGAGFALVVGGGGGARSPNAGGTGSAYGFGGGSGNNGYGSGGGGLSGIFTGTSGVAYTDNTGRAVLVAGGGGGGDYDRGAAGGPGGGATGASVTNSSGGTQSAAGTGLNSGSYMQGARAGGGDEGGGAGGGGGYWGGGSGDGNSGWAGSGGSGFIGGRAGYTVSSGVTNQGSGRTPDNTGNAYYGNSAGYGGSGGGYNGGNAGRIVIVY